MCLFFLLFIGVLEEPKAGAPAAGATIVLFNGKDLTGWSVEHGGKYTVEGGKLIVSSGNGWLRTKEKYNNFDLTVEWRADQKYKASGVYDSGLFFRTGVDGKPWPKSKYQFNMKRGEEGNLPGIHPKGFSEIIHPPGEWNKFRVRVIGVQAEGWVNDRPAWKTSKIKDPSGYIGLQAEGFQFEFRKIELTVIE